MEVRVLGEVELAREGSPLPLRRPTLRHLLALLTLRANRVVASDEVVEGLWPERRPRDAQASVHLNVCRLRKVLTANDGDGGAAASIETRRSGYVLHLLPDQLDAWRFEALLGEAREAWRAGQLAAAADCFETALGLWRDGAFGEVADAAFAHLEAERLNEMRLGALEDLNDVQLAVGAHAEWLPELQAAVAAHPLRERLWAQRIIALYRAGRQADALVAFQDVRRTLRNELGIEPSRDLQRLETAILNQATDLHQPSAAFGGMVPISGLEARSLITAAAPSRQPTTSPCFSAPPTVLVEREGVLAALAHLLDDATAGHGGVALLSGEAGVGKSSIVRSFAAMCQRRARFLVGACDHLSTPRTLSPLFDIAEQTGGLLASVGSGEASRHDLFSTFLQEVRREPSVVVIEDLHWADEATLDLVRFAGRRVAGTHTLLIVTYRNEEISPALRALLADLASLRTMAAITVPPLTLSGIAELADGHPVDVTALQRRTGGNPFFVTEILAHGGAELPLTVRHAVLSRAEGLSAAARAVVDAAAVIGTRAEFGLVKASLGAVGSGVLAECEARGILRSEGTHLVFRHELARAAVEEALLSSDRIELNRRVLEEMLKAPLGTWDVARLAHHSAAADDGRLAAEFSVLAGSEAAALGAHREAAEHYRRALASQGWLDQEAIGEIWDALAKECYLTQQLDAAVAAGRAAVRTWTDLGDVRRQGRSLTSMVIALWLIGDADAAEEAAQRALEVLESLPPGPELAMAYAQRSRLAMQHFDFDGALNWGHRAIELAEATDHTESLVHALASVGCAEIRSSGSYAGGRSSLERSLELAVDVGLDEHVARARFNLLLLAHSRYDRVLAESCLAHGLAFSEERDLDVYTDHFLGQKGYSLLLSGRWAEARKIFHQLLHRRQRAPSNEIYALCGLGILDMRQGRPSAKSRLDRALYLVQRAGSGDGLMSVGTACAEAAWLEGDNARAAEEASRVLELAREATAIGDAAVWLWRAGALNDLPAGLLEPRALELAGDWEGAEQWWKVAGCPYEAALALWDSGNADALQRSLAEFEHLGARPMAALVAERLSRSRGRRDRAASREGFAHHFERRPRW